MHFNGKLVDYDYRGFLFHPDRQNSTRPTQAGGCEIFPGRKVPRFNDLGFEDGIGW